MSDPNSSIAPTSSIESHTDKPVENPALGLSPEQRLSQATALYNQGNELERADKWEEAIECFSKALEICVPDMSDSKAMASLSFDPFVASLLYKYGTCLLYNYHATANVFGDVAQSKMQETTKAIVGDLNEENSSSDESEEDVIYADQEAEKQKSSVTTIAESKKEEEKPVENDVSKTNDETSAKNSSQGDQIEENGESDSDDEEQSEEGESDSEEDKQASAQESAIEDLELAWQILELARIMYSSRTDYKLELSDVHFSLGQVALENEKEAEAAAEFDKCLTFAKEANDRRAQAQALLMIATVQESKNEMDNASSSLETAVKLLKDEIEAIKAKDANSQQIEILQSSIADIEGRIFTLKEEWTPADPEDVKDLPPPGAPIKFSFTPPAGFAKPTLPNGPVTTLLPKKKVTTATSTTSSTTNTIASTTSTISSTDANSSSNASSTVNTASTTTSSDNNTTSSSTDITTSNTNDNKSELDDLSSRGIKRSAEDANLDSELPDAKRTKADE